MMSDKTMVAALVVFLALLSSTYLHAAPAVNQLRDHPAPYLGLHGDDPVAWQTWGSDAVQTARAENKIMFVSVGYFACHWCHVMQQESYQNQAVAEVLNDHFVSIKVDRELEPALDNRLMSFAQATLGQGGWPLNVFLTPEGHPIFALLYVPREQFQQVIERIQQLWQEDPDKVRALVAQQQAREIAPLDADLDIPSLQALLQAAPQQVMARADTFLGGFGNQSKFPSAPQLDYLLEQYRQTADEEIKEFLLLTLDAMATQGIHDHLSGGFFRYAVDPAWEVPHFEKMLYDNANLAMLYIKAGRQFNRQDYHQVARHTLDFMADNMWQDGALVSSFSAVDDDNIEGGYYLWQREQVAEILNQQEFAVVAAAWGLDRNSELDAGNQLRWHQSLADLSQQTGIAVAQLLATLQSAANKMLAVRKQRSLPVDDKLLAGWNGLALSAFVMGAREYPSEEYRGIAAQLKTFLATRVWDGSNLTRALAGGERYGTASLEDFAYVSRGLLHWAQLSTNPDDLELAAQLARTGWKLFFVDNGWYRQAASLLAPPVGIELMEDGASPSPAAVLISASFSIATQLDDQQWLKLIRGAVNRGDNEIEASPFWFASHMLALQQVLQSR